MKTKDKTNHFQNKKNILNVIIVLTCMVGLLILQMITHTSSGDSYIQKQNANGQATFISGRFSDVKVHDTQSAMDALRDMKKVLYFPTDTSELLLNHAGEDSCGNQYYRFTAQVKNSDYVAEEYALILTADKGGNVLSISSSSSDYIYDDDMESLTYNTYQKKWWDEFDKKYGDVDQYQMLSESPKLVFSKKDNMYDWCKYYLNLKSNLVEEIAIAANDIGTEVNTDNTFESDVCVKKNYYDYDNYLKGSSYKYDFLFEDKDTEMKKFVDGFGKIVELPCAYDPEKGFYILDQERKIISICEEGGDEALLNPKLLYFPEEYFEAITKTTQKRKTEINFEDIQQYISSDSVNVEELSTIVSAISTTIDSYDAYKRNHMLIDTTPILVDFLIHEKKDDASCNNMDGSLLLKISNNSANKEFDGVSHEIGHGVLSIEAGFLPYMNAAGAINESYADILGNLLEMYEKKQGNYEGYVDFDRWLIGEYAGGYQYEEDGKEFYSNGTLRNMSDPEKLIYVLDSDGNLQYFKDQDGNIMSEEIYYQVPQTSKVGGNNYVQPDTKEDNGGVHSNNGILNNICYKMYQTLFGDAEDKNGETYQEMFAIWSDTLQYLTVDTSYQDVMYYVRQSMKNHGYSTEDIEKVSTIFQSAVIPEVKKESKE